VNTFPSNVYITPWQRTLANRLAEEVRRQSLYAQIPDTDHVRLRSLRRTAIMLSAQTGSNGLLT